MKNNKFRRAHLRAPLTTQVLYVDGGDVLATDSLNISEGGILLECLPKAPESDAIAMMIPLPIYPDFSQISSSEILNLKLKNMPQRIIRVELKLVRTYQGMTDIDKIFVTKVGCKFVKARSEDKKLIKDYVVHYNKNLIFLLGLFEGKGGSEGKKMVRHCSELLGYDSDMPMGQLRLKTLHDYQSLESL
jgi:hypothetical protein